MAKGDPKKPKGKMSAYAFFVQTCREELKKKNPEVPVNFAEFSKKCSERWKAMSGKEKSKSDEMAEVNKVRYDQEMKDYGPAKGGKNKKDTSAPKDHHLDSSCSVQNSAPRPSDSKKQPYITKAAKLKKYEKDVADYKSKGKFDGTKGPAKVAQKKVEEEEEEEEEEVEEKDE
ncbi:High mobility group protein B3 [Sciurus carolinensis]|uniref:High mobility group protein B3 n=1 Tax=Sciurus carolinensis TaxID=30640 RepID=A0AA41MYF8_SCICA|nr:High mobility group protein B3 [Sciurus carolinensis]